MKLLYIYSGLRKGRYKGILGVDHADSRFWGMNHMKYFGIDAKSLEWSDIAPAWIRKILGFRLQHLFMFFASRNYDIVFGPSLLYMMVLRMFIPSKAKYVLFNTSLIRTLCDNKNNPLRYRIILRLVKMLDAIVCPANSQKEWLEAEYPWLTPKLYFVHLGVDTSFYKPLFSGREKYVLSVGYDIGRDYQTLMRVAERLPDIIFKVVCHPLNLENVIKIPPNVEVYHDTPFDELNGMYKSAGLALLLTRDDRVQFGSNCSGQTALLDSMACGIPVIMTRQECIREYATDGSEIYLVEPYADDDIARLIPKLLAESPFDMVKRARLKVESLSTENMARELVNIFKKLV